MSLRNRELLKNSFKQGSKPGEKDFENLIDSMMNILDDGISKTNEAGLELSPNDANDTVLSISQKQELHNPLWKIALNKENNNLEIRYCENRSESPVLLLKVDGTVVWGNEDEVSLRHGTIRAKFRQGSLYNGTVPADGKWHDITGELTGMQAFEITAFAGNEDDRKQAVLIAVATCCSGRHARMVQTTSYSRCFTHKIRLRWRTSKKAGKATLQAKTMRKYNNDKQIQYNITGLHPTP